LNLTSSEQELEGDEECPECHAQFRLTENESLRLKSSLSVFKLQERSGPSNPFFLVFTWVMEYFATHSWQGILVCVIWIALVVAIAFNSDPPEGGNNPITKEEWPRYVLEVGTMFPLAAIPWLLMILSGLSWRLIIGKRRLERLKEGLDRINETVEELGGLFYAMFIPTILILGLIGFAISRSNDGPRNAPLSGFKRMFETKEERERNIKIDKLLDKALEGEDE